MCGQRVILWLSREREYIFIANFGSIIYQIAGNLTLKKNPNYIESFFSDNASIDQITAIVGRNGSGKTSVLRFMVSLLANGNEGFASQVLKEPILCVFRMFGSDELFVMHNPNLKLTGGNYEEYNLEVICPDFFQKRCLVEDSTDFFNNTSVVLYSNIFDHSFTENGNRLIDMTTNTLLSKSTFNDQVHETLAHRYDDIRRQINFFLEQRNSPFWAIPFEVPKELHFRFSGLIKRLEVKLKPDIVNFGSGSSGEKYEFENYIYRTYYELEDLNDNDTSANGNGTVSLSLLFLLLFL